MMDDGDYGSARSYYESALKLAPSSTDARTGVECESCNGTGFDKE